jgi:VWFA-related protein
MRKLTITVVLLICGFLAYDDPASGQNKSKKTLSVYLITVKGDCMPEQSVAIYNGRAIATGSKIGEKKQTTLTRFEEDAGVRETVEKEFKKNRAFRIVDSLDEADIVLHICSSYFGEFGSKIILKGRYFLPSTRVAARALAIPAAIYQPTGVSTSKLTDSAIWKADTLSSNSNKSAEQGKNQKKKTRGKTKSGAADPQITPVLANPEAKIIFDKDFDGDMLVEASALELAQRFIKDAPTFKRMLGGFPNPSIAEGAERRLPRLNTDRTGKNDVRSFKTGASQVMTGIGDEEVESLKIDTALVVVPVSAMDRDGKYIPGLKREDFQITENGALQQISDFGSEETPFNLVLMLDVSTSTIFKVEDIHEAALLFINQLRPQDRVMVVSFDRTIKVHSEFTNNRDQLKFAILSATAGGATRLYDAIDLVITERLRNVQGRKAIVLFTDGVDTASRLAQVKEVIDHVEESGVLVYPVRYDTFDDARLPDDVAAKIQLIAATRSLKNYEYAIKFLIELSTRSGGRYYNVGSVSDTKRAFSNIIEELRRQYWIGYYPSNTAEDGGYRRIRVSVKKPGVVIRARQGYRAQCGAECIPEPEKPNRPALTNVKPE